MTEAAATLRPLQFPADVAPIRCLDQECFAREDWFHEELLEAFVRAAASEDRRSLWARVAVDESGAACGFVFADPSHSRITKVCAAPRCQRRGIGQALVTAAVAALRARKALSVSLFVRVSNGPARALYAKCGFAVDGTEVDYYGKGLDGHRMLLDCFSRC